MKQTSLLLFICSFAIQLVQAQPTLSVPNRKLSPVLQNNRNLLFNKQERIFWIVASNVDSAKNYFAGKKMNVRIVQEYPGGLLVVSAKGVTIDSTLALPFVRFVDIPRKPKEELALNPFDNSLNTINMVHNLFPQLKGNNMVVSVKENKPDTTDIDFKGRFISSPLSSPLSSSHATYMSTIIAGGENSFYTSGGIVPAAGITSSNFESLLPDADNDYKKYGVSVQNHSYGTGIENYYGADAAAYDASTINNPGLLHVFSSGNSGNLVSAGTYAGITGMANLTGSFKMGKNILTVGATDSFGNVSVQSSKGPAYDGRLKPELVAFGEDGSSGAAAHASGVVLLLQQYHRELMGNLPPAALIKAVLINSADDRGAKGPDYSNGYGSLNAFKALQHLGNGQFLIGTVAQGATQTFPLQVAAFARQLKLTLCWLDPAAAANAPKALINDLDIELVNNSTGQVWQPWVLSPVARLDSLQLPAVRKRDTLNNIEQITLDNPTAGSYTIRVKGAAIPAGSQPFYIAWQQEEADVFRWQYPTASDPMRAGENNLLRWSSTFNTANGLLEYSLNKGVSWQRINTNTPLANGNLYWQTPDTYQTALLRMTINGQVFNSDTFTISREMPLRVGFACADSTMLIWDPVPGIKSYVVYGLAEKYLQPLFTTADTSIVIRQPGQQLWYAVAPVIDARHQGIKAYTINVTMQGISCYLKNFLVDLQSDNTGLLTGSIGTTYNVRSITFEKLTHTGFVELKTFMPVSTTDFEHIDKALVDGVNTYRMKIVLTNGQVIYSNQQSIYYFHTTQYLLFPNPVAARQALTVLTKEDPINTNLLLFNVMGQQVLQMPLRQRAETVTLPELRTGVYVVVIQKDKKKVFTGKIVVR